MSMPIYGFEKELCRDMKTFEAALHGGPTFCEEVRRWAQTHPQHTAVVSEGQQLTYEELDRRSSVLAAYLLEQGIHREDIVGISTGRSAETVVAILGIWKAGAAYVYLNASMTKDVNSHILEDCRCPLVLDHARMEQAMKTDDPGDLDFSVPDGLALVVYTSGSTAAPKGVMLEHRAVYQMALNQGPMEVTPEDHYCIFASFSFVASVSDMVGAIRGGATCYIIGEAYRRDIHKLESYLVDNRITICFLPPHMAIKLTQETPPGLSLRLLLAGSDCVHNLCSDQFRIFHVYGATEAGSLIAHYPITERRTSYPVGKLNPSLRGYVVDETGKPVPKGQAGELWLAGPQISRGYVGLRELTAATYALNPFTQEKGYQRVLKTADIVREDENGDLVYVARKGRMYKIRGFRVESRAVELTLLQYPGITEAVVIAFPDSGGTNILCGYYTAEETIGPKELKAYLRERLPYYMVPTCMFQLERFPLNANNKVDRKQLRPPAELDDHKYLEQTY